MEKYFKILIVSGLLFTGFVSSSQNDKLQSAIEKISNKDVYIVILDTLSARIKNPAATEIIEYGRDATPELFIILDSDTKGIAAHILLSKIWKTNWIKNHANYISSNGINEMITIFGLNIYIIGNDFNVKPEDLRINKVRWKTYLQT